MTLSSLKRLLFVDGEGRLEDLFRPELLLSLLMLVDVVVVAVVVVLVLAEAVAADDARYRLLP